MNYAAEIGIVGALAFFWYFFGTMFMSFGVSFNSDDGDSSFTARMKKIFESNSFLQYLLELAEMINAKLAAFSNAFINLFNKKSSPPVKVKKIRRSQSELVHHDELKLSSRRGKVQQTNSDDENIASVEKISVGGEKISAKVVKLDTFDAPDSANDSDKSFVDFSDVTKLDDQKFLEGFRLGIGLAFLSMALNGFTDDLLFNIPSSMLMWQLGALSATMKSS